LVNIPETSTQETLVAELTPPGRGAIATVGIWGPRAKVIAQQVLFGKGETPVGLLPVGRVRLCQFRCPGHPPETVVVCRVEPTRIHIHCHGGRAAVRRVMETVSRQGARIVSGEEWIDRTTPSKWEAQCLRALVRATTPRVAGILLDQLAGAFPRELEEIAQILAGRRMDEAKARIERLRKRYQLGRHLLEPWFVLLAGPTNAGKSSLFNCLVGFERVIAHPAPGTTRDVVKETVAIDGWPISLADSAGFGAPTDPLDEAAMAKAHSALTRADLVLWVVDLQEDWTDPWEWVKRLGTDGANLPFERFLYVHNKADLVGVPERSVRLRGRPPGIITSAKTGEGVGALWLAIRQRLVPEVPPPKVGVPFLPEHAGIVARVEMEIRRGRPEEAIAEIDRFFRAVCDVGRGQG